MLGVKKINTNQYFCYFLLYKFILCVFMCVFFSSGLKITLQPTKTKNIKIKNPDFCLPI